VDAAIDRHDIGMFGHSGGGFEALQLLHDDPRIKAAMDLDGILGWAENDTDPALSALARGGIDKPYALVGSATNDHYTSPSWSALWNASHGWHRDLHVQGTEHASFTDAEPLISQAAKKTSLPAQATQGIGWIHPAAALAAESTYITGFFDQWLRGRDTGLFDHADPAQPRVALVR
jgi:dienelactone hydrolase